MRLIDTSCWVHPAQMVNDNLHRNGLEPLLQARDVGTIEMKLDEPAQGRNAAHHMIEYGQVQRAAVLRVEGEAHAACAARVQLGARRG